MALFMRQNGNFTRSENNFFDYQTSKEQELTTELFCRPGLRVERIASAGQSSGPYCQEEDEWVLLLEGRAQVRCETAERVWTEKLEAGDWLYIPAGLRHWVENSSEKGLWLCCFVRPEKKN